MIDLTPEEVKEKLDANANVHLLDVREPNEHEEYNIGGILVPLGHIQQMQTEAIDDLKNEEIICYCRSGNRSKMAAHFLEQMGFSNVKNMSGGVTAWKEKFDNT